MAIWSKNSNSSNQTLRSDEGMVGGLSVDAQSSSDRRGAHSNGRQDNDMTVKDYMTGMPNIRLTALFTGLVKQIVWIIPVFLIGCFAIYYFTKDIKRSYRGEGSLLVQIGPEYIYTPVGTPTNNAAGVSQTPDTIALNEVGIMKNSAIIDEVLRVMTTPKDGVESVRAAQDLFDKDAYKKIREAERKGKRTGNYRDFDDARAELHKSVSEAYMVAPRPKSSLIDVAFKHENPTIAVETLKQFILAYQRQRQILFVTEAENTIIDRRKETEKLLKANELAIARFLERNDISDFTSVQTGLRKRSEDLKAELNTLRGLMSETEGSLATVEDQLRVTEPTINLYVDDRASQRIAQAELELKQLLAKYLPTSNPVSQKRTELAELKALQSANNGRAAGGRRVGPNPTYQALVTRRNTLQSTADSYREKEFTLQGQLNSAVNKVRNLTKLSPEHQNLMRQRTTLSAALDTYNAREQEAIVNANQNQANSENIKVISEPTFAIKGPNTRMLIWAGGSLVWGLTLVMIALLRVFSDPRNFQAPSASRSGPRRGRSTDYTRHDDGGIPEPLSPYSPYSPSVPYEPHMPMPAAGGAGSNSAVVKATRAYNASANTQAASSQSYDSNTYEPAVYNPTAYNNVAPYGNPQDYYADPMPTAYNQATPQSSAQTPTQAQIDMQNNPYLNMQNQADAYGGTYDRAYSASANTQPSAQINSLPVLGSFSAGKG